jgi:hypothetical protein
MVELREIDPQRARAEEAEIWNYFGRASADSLHSRRFT